MLLWTYIGNPPGETLRRLITHVEFMNTENFFRVKVTQKLSHIDSNSTMTQLLSQVDSKSQLKSPSHKTESDWLKFDHDLVFESFDSETESPTAMLIFSRQIYSITESWLNLNQYDSIFMSQTDSFYLKISESDSTYMCQNWDNMTQVFFSLWLGKYSQ